MKIYIIDTGAANLNSVVQAFKRLNIDAIVSSDTQELKNADKLVLPGVGAAKAVMDGVNNYRLNDFICNNKKPLLGICLGMQIQAIDSEEIPQGSSNKTIDCLSIVKSHVIKMKDDSVRLPHMGWNTVEHTDHPLFDKIKQNAYFYFDHSYAMDVSDCTIGKTSYGIEFSAAIAKDNFMGVQFHPEKSSHAGEQLLLNFLNNF